MAELKTDSWFSLSTGMFIHNNFETKGERKRTDPLKKKSETRILLTVYVFGSSLKKLRDSW